MTDLWFGTSGPQNAKIVLVGESWGFEEAQAKVPFVGTSGTELNRMLAEAKLNRDEILCTNVIAARPPNNETWRFCHPAITKPPIRINGIAAGPELRSEVSRLYGQITAHPRSLVIATGNWSLWALSQVTKAKVLSESNNKTIPKDLRTWVPTGIQAWRGSMTFVQPHKELLNGLPYESLANTYLLPLIHPAAIMRSWEDRAPTVHDLKARVPLALRNDWRRNPLPTCWAPPTFAQVKSRIEMWLSRANSGNRIQIAEDIETARGLITCLGFSDGPNFAMSIPFVRRVEGDDAFHSWWTPEQEAEVVALLIRLNRHPNVLIVGQNFVYDTQYIQHWFGVTPSLDWDTMLCQNVLFPGTPKDLSYLSSLFCRYHWYWKEDHKEWNLKGTIEELLLYNCEDALRTWEIADSQRVLVKHLKQEVQMNLKMQTNNLCLRMMNRGVLIDNKRRQDLKFELGQVLSGVQQELLNIIPQDFVQPHTKKNDTFWYNSPSQTATLFYDILGLPSIYHHKTKQRTVGKEALPELKRRAPEFTAIYNRLETLGSLENVLDICQAQTDSDNRIRCSYNPGGAESHRLSSSKNVFGRGTNLQNLTKGEEDE